VIKSELILRLAGQDPHLFQRDVEKLVDAIFDEIVEALARGGRVELEGMWHVSAKVREGRVRRNPRTGDTVQLPEKNIPYFRQGHEMRKRLNLARAGVKAARCRRASVGRGAALRCRSSNNQPAGGAGGGVRRYDV